MNQLVIVGIDLIYRYKPQIHYAGTYIWNAGMPLISLIMKQMDECNKEFLTPAIRPLHKDYYCNPVNCVASLSPIYRGM